MADQGDIDLEKVLDELRDFYTGLVICYLRLPIPIALPTEINQFKDVTDAVARAYDLIDDQPMPEDALAVLTTTTLYWISAAELVTTFVGSGKESHAHAALLSMLAGQDHMRDFIHWTIAGHLPED
ncbi:hypothetical protein [Streptomyces sp. NPDC057910]|uniref:hypothetical protein n=1 Tax=Streptomyces sp. NPDC057910 TaxID=3346278 RepID=UPI001E0EC13F|nr:hypothetical protein [Streptomyces sp. MAG02]